MAVNFYWGSVQHLMMELTVLISLSNSNMTFLAGGGQVDSEQNRERAREGIEIAKFCGDQSEKLFAKLKCVHITDAAQRLRRMDEERFTWAELNTRSRALRDSITNELKEHLYYQYSRKKGEKLAEWPKDWQRSLAAFPDIRTDVFCATDCYALGHDTASVFHSMRVAEHGLRALAKERKVKLPKNKQVEWATWQEIIKGLDDEIKLIGTTKKSGASKDAALEFYSGARADLNGFKDEYRNQVTHVRATYDELQALRALNNVNTFMERIAAKIDHNHHRIRWGLR